MNSYTKLATQDQIDRTIQSLEKNGFTVILAKNGQEAKVKALSLIKKGSSVMTATSTTNNQIGLSDEIENSKNFISLRKKIMTLPDSKQRSEARRINSAPDYVVGSVHSITEDGHVIVASNSGSQLPAYAYSAEHVIWVVGTQKITKDTASGLKRLEDHVLKLESERLMQIYGVASSISKLLIINKEVTPGRVTIILTKEKLGF